MSDYRGDEMYPVEPDTDDEICCKNCGHNILVGELHTITVEGDFGETVEIECCIGCAEDVRGSNQKSTISALRSYLKENEVKI